MAALAYFVTTLRAKFEDKEKGATAVEYGLMVALVAVAIIAAVTFMSDQLDLLFRSIGNTLTP